jgi:hypothetical protein
MGLALALRSVAIAVAAMALNVAFFFLWVFLYSTFIAPGQEAAAYEAYANRTAPWSSVIAGIPILLAGGWVLARWHGGGWRAAIGAGVAYAVIDLVILTAAGALFGLLGIAALSWSTKIAAAALGGLLAGRRLVNA